MTYLISNEVYICAPQKFIFYVQKMQEKNKTKQNEKNERKKGGKKQVRIK
jgi:hypothetical protein